MAKAGIQINIVGAVDAAAFRKAEQEIAKLGTTAQKAGAQGSKGLDALKKPAADLKSAFGQLSTSFGGQFGTGAFGALRTAFGAVKAEFGGLTSLWQVGGAQLAALGGIAAVAGAGLIIAAKKAADAYAGWATEVKTVQTRTGASAEDASRLTVVLDHLGISTDDAGRAFQILGKNIIQATPAFRQYFTATQFAQLGHNQLIQSLPVLQAKYQSLSTAQEKSAFVMAAFGRGGAALRPLLALTAEETAHLARESDRLGLTLTQAGIDKATEYKRALNDMHLAMRSIAVNAGPAVIGALTSVANAIVSVKASIDKVQPAFQWLFGSNNRPDALVRGLYSLSGGHIDLRRKVDETSRSVKDQIGAMDEDAQAADDLESATLGLYNANRSYDRAVRSVGDAQQSLADAQRNLSKLQAQGAVDAKAVADAHRDVERAARGVEQAERGVYDADRGVIQSHQDVARAERSLISAQESLADSARNAADAQQSLLEAQRRLKEVQAGPDALTLAEAQLRAQQSATSLQRAQQRLSQAEANAVKVSGDYHATILEKQDAELSVTEASQGVTAAQIDQQRAEEDLNRITNAGKEGSDEYADALKGVQDASRAVEQASRQQRDAQQAVYDSQLALVESAGRVEQAEYGHQQALLAVRDAQQAVQDAGQKLREAEAGDPDFADRLASARRGVASAERSLSDARLDAGAAALARVQAEEKESDALALAGRNAQVLIDKITALRTRFPQMAAFWDQLIGVLSTSLLGSSPYYAGLPGSPFAGPPVPGRAVPGFQHGGTVPGPLGRPMLAVVHGGEQIRPAGATTTVNIYVAGSVIAERALADTMQRALVDVARRGG